MSLISEGSSGETEFDGCGLKLRHVTTQRELDAVEFANMATAALKYLSAKPSRRIAPFDYDWLLKLHREMFGEVWEWAGEVRRYDLNIGVSHFMVPERLGALAMDISYWGRTDPMREAVEIHHRAVQIHPFRNGNGRWARMLCNIWLKQCEQPLIIWPDAELRQGVHPYRNQYIDCLRAADNSDPNPLRALHEKFQDASV